MTRLILHIGTHKTGTTSIQKALADNRDWLRGTGLLYPDGGTLYTGRQPHHQWAHSLTGVAGREPQKAYAFIDYALSIADPAGTIILSAEPLYRHIDGFDTFDVFERPDYWVRRERYLRNCAATLVHCEVRVIVWFREKAAFSRSLHAEMVAKGHWVGSFDRFLESYAVWFDYDRHLALIRQKFGNVDAFSYDQDRENLIPQFFTRIGFPMPAGAGDIWERRTEHVATMASRR